jgi:hypothetical protein
LLSVTAAVGDALGNPLGNPLGDPLGDAVPVASAPADGRPAGSGDDCAGAVAA